MGGLLLGKFGQPLQLFQPCYGPDKHTEQIFADYILVKFYFREIKFSRIDGNSANFAKITSRENFTPHGMQLLCRLLKLHDMNMYIRTLLNESCRNKLLLEHYDFGLSF